MTVESNIQIKKLQLDLLLRQSWKALFSVFAVSTCLLFLVVFGGSTNAIFLIWYALLNAIAIVRFFIHRNWHSNLPSLDESVRLTNLRRLFVAGVTISGILWGLVALVPLGARADPVEALSFFVLAGMCSGAVVSYSAYFPAIAGFLLPALLPTIAKLLIHGGSFDVIMAGIAVIYLWLMFQMGMTLSQSTIRSLRLRFENSELVLRLKEEIKEKDQKAQSLNVARDSLNMALQSSGAVIWEWDAYKIIWHGDIKKLLDLGDTPPPSTLLEFLGFVHPDDRWRIERAMREATEGARFFELEYRLDRDGSNGPRYLASRGSCRVETFRSENYQTNPLRELIVSGISWDITSRRERELLLVQKEAAEESAASKMRLLASASHEIRTPLAAICGFSKLIMNSDCLSEEVARDVSVIDRNAEHLRVLVDDLLGFAAEGDQRRSGVCHEFAVSEELEKLVAGFLPDSEKLGIRLNLNIGDLPDTIQSDPTKFRRIVMNLISNAVKFTPAGGQVSVDARLARKKLGISDALVISVADTGIGIEPDLAAKLFRPFVRGSSHEVQSKEGSGLGLALSRKLAVELGGELALSDSQLGKGSVFEFSLPLKHTCSVPRTTMQARSLVSEAPLLGRRILLVDDIEDQVFLGRRVLENLGATVTICHDGREAVSTAKKEEFDLIIMDIMMPEMDGHDATKHLRSDGYTGRIVALTALASPGEREKCLDEGFNDFLTKPLGSRHLATLRKHVAAQLS